MRWWWLKLARYALPQWPALAIVGTLMLAGVAASLLRPWPLKLIVDHVLPREADSPALAWLRALPGTASPRGQLAWLAAATVGLFLLRQLLTMTQKYVAAGAGSRMTFRLASDLFDQLQRQSLLFHSRHRVGDLVRRVTSDTTCARNLVMGVYLPVVTSLITLVSMFWVMWKLSPTLALLAMTTALPLGLVIKWFARPMAQRRYHELQLKGDVTAFAEQTLTALPIVQSFTRERAGERRFRSLTGRTTRANVRAAYCEEQFKVSAGLISATATAAVMLLGGLYVLRGEASVGTLIVFLTYFAALYSPLETLAYLGTSFAAAKAGARRVMELLESRDEGVREAPGAVPLPVPAAPAQRGHVRVDKVSFGYEPRKHVLREVSIEARPGERVAIVGHSGGGKSTLVSLLVRLYDPWGGRIELDGLDVREVTLESLRESVSIVPQEPFLLPLTVADNIAYGRPEATRLEVIEAAKSACAHEFIERLPQGYDTVIGERACTLSGGERQRLSIARALLKDAPVLILDEPTSALDAGTEATLLQAFRRLMEGRTTFIIAHRLSTIRDASRIVVLDRGRIVEQGAHRELLEAGGHYRRLYEQQFGNPDEVVA